jgi:hypothetical protein
VWYDSKGKVWQRWNDQVIGGAWDGSLKRYVYEGGQLVQEHDWDVMEDQGSWVYTYNDIDRDYLRHQGGIRQREGGASSYNDFYLQQSGSSIEIKTQRDQASATIARAERTQSLNQMAGTTFTDISNLATSNSPVAMYGGGTSGATGGFDGLVHKGGGSHYFLSGLGRRINGPTGSKGLTGGNAGPPLVEPAYRCNCEDCADLIRGHFTDFEGGDPLEQLCCSCEWKILGNAIYNDPCLAEGREYDCIALVCGDIEGSNGCPCIEDLSCSCERQGRRSKRKYLSPSSVDPCCGPGSCCGDSPNFTNGCPPVLSSDCFDHINYGLIFQALSCFGCIGTDLKAYYYGDYSGHLVPWDRLLTCVIIAETGGYFYSDGCFQIEDKLSSSGADCLNDESFLDLLTTCSDFPIQINQWGQFLKDCIKKHGVKDCIQYLQQDQNLGLLCSIFELCKYPNKADRMFSSIIDCGKAHSKTGYTNNKFDCCMNCCTDLPVFSGSVTGPPSGGP